MNINNISKEKSVPNDELDKKEKININSNVENSGRIFIQFKEPMVSLFENVFARESIREIKLKDFLFTDKYRKFVENYRIITDEKLKLKIKRNLPCITPSGIFSLRQVWKTSIFTKLICIDIDSKHNPDIELRNLKNRIGKHFPSLYYAGLSLGGEGIFLIFRISFIELYELHFNALAHDLKTIFGLNVDKSVKSPISLRVVSYDPNPYYNPTPIIYQEVRGITTFRKLPKVLEDRRNNIERVERAISCIQRKQIDITKGYNNWLKIGLALAYEFGEDGRIWYQIISYYHERYCYYECDKQYDRCMKYGGAGKIKIGTFLFYCKEYGINYNR